MWVGTHMSRWAFAERVVFAVIIVAAVVAFCCGDALVGGHIRAFPLGYFPTLKFRLP